MNVLHYLFLMLFCRELHNRKCGVFKDIDSSGFEVIKLYTANEAYVSLFSSVYSLFRTDNTTDVPTLITVAVFLIELINIELFNLVLKEPHKSNFEGTVYRGLTVTAQELENIKVAFKSFTPFSNTRKPQIGRLNFQYVQ